MKLWLRNVFDCEERWNCVALTRTNQELVNDSDILSHFENGKDAREFANDLGWVDVEWGNVIYTQ
tara:strand:- start:809 stop:1003 length:195 start_codon:yes stop_codon:yes gene_type:complete